jgi:hypothetical protein
MLINPIIQSGTLLISHAHPERVTIPILVLSFHLSLGLSSGLSSGIRTKILRALLLMCATCLVHLIPIDLIIPISFSAFLQPALISSLFYPNVLLSTLFSSTFSLYSSLNPTDQFNTRIELIKTKLKLNSVAFSPQANYTDRATAACRRISAKFCGYRVSRG